MSLFSQASDLELAAQLGNLLIDERSQLVAQLECIAELDRRKAFFHYPSLCQYLVEEHGLEEWLAFRRIRAARTLIRFPELKPLLESGKLNLSLLELAFGCAHREKLEDRETLELMQAVSGKSCQRARREIAARYPQSAELPRD